MKKKIQNIIIATIAVGILGGISVYYYQIDLQNQQGRQFGYELQSIQSNLKAQQDLFVQKSNELEEGKITDEEFEKFSEKHFDKMEELIKSYDNLNPPEPYQSSVKLFRQSTESQLQSDKEYVKWIKTGSNQTLVRSDQLLQDSYEYEMAALSDYKNAQQGE
ncbi:MAG: hypothetical protein GWN01_05165 [Nitrosopumilaceae archaeon]|nr:hypothetical protein [Nitrosopumilaceae archaeon]NIU00333.1 hypothetical protein [Nitrosopumilaceae archaeon]NIU86735.1 hypothetical protein [Nitrosopumilaceae archaeon]NIV65436.1 hypothetical protein [Nitrosopumilaceae archaeon]NIX60935.1 hypothetical protein [Nitrosopumilaceae archaeon]